MRSEHRILVSSVVTVALIAMAAQAVHARPPGWDKGKKKGWQGGNMPPGLAKKGGWIDLTPET